MLHTETSHRYRIRLPERRVLYPFQDEGTRKMINFLTTTYTHGVYNAAEPGCGKTIMTMATLNTLNAADTPIRTALIVCPAVMRLVWEKEILDWSVIKKPSILIVRSSKDLDDVNLKLYNFIVISYDLLSKQDVKEAFTAGNFRTQCLIADELHYTKSPTAKRTSAFYNIYWPRAHYRIGLSGTPFTSSVVDGYTAFSAFAPDTFRNYYEFANRYAHKKNTQWGPKYDGVKNADELGKIIRSKFFIRYLKEDVLEDLPEKTYVEVPLGKEYSTMTSKDIASLFYETKKKIESGQAFVPPPALATIRREQGLKKIPAIVEYVSILVSEDIPVVLFAYHREVLEKLKSALAAYNPGEILMGGTSDTQKIKIKDDFQSGKTNLFIGQLKAAGIGITLTRSSNVILAETDWSPGITGQAIDRVHRITQKNAVTVHYFVVKDSIDEMIQRTVIQKSKSFSRVLD